MTPMLPVSSAMRASLVWSDEFTGDLSKWIQDDFTSTTWHRTGTKFLKSNGEIDLSLRGIVNPSRHAAMQHKHRDKVQFVRDGMLVLKPYVEQTNNIFRKNIKGRDGRLLPFANYVPYSPWLSTWTSLYSNKHERHITDWTKTTLQLGKGSIVETRVNMEKQCMGGVRFSFWLMPSTIGEDSPDKPAIVVAGDSYNNDSSIMEIDLIERENAKFHDANFGNYAFMKCIGGRAGDTETPKRQNKKAHPYNVKVHFDIDLSKGWHTLTLVWNENGTLEFYCDGILVNVEKRKLDFNAYLIMSCEMCSGLKDANASDLQDHENISNGPKAPVDVGLSSRSWIDDRDYVDQQEVYVDYVRVFDINDGSRLDTAPLIANSPKLPPTPTQSTPTLHKLAEGKNDQTINTVLNSPIKNLSKMKLPDQVEALLNLYDVKNDDLVKTKQRLNKALATLNKATSANKRSADVAKKLTKEVATLKAENSDLQNDRRKLMDKIDNMDLLNDSLTERLANALADGADA